MRTELFLALRYLKPRRNAVSVITLISIAGVMLGVAVLMVVLAVMTGFTDIMKTKLIQTQAHIQVTAGPSAIQNIADVQKILEEAGCVGSAPVITLPAILQVRSSFDPKLVLGVRSEDIRERMKIDEVLQPGGRFDLNPGEAVVGSRLAARYGLYIGKKFILYSSSQLAEQIKVRPEGGIAITGSDTLRLPCEFTVAGVVSFGKYDFDRDVIFLNLDDAADLFNMRWGSATAVYGWVQDPFKLDDQLAKLRTALPEPMYDVESWQTINAQLLSALMVEKNMMFFLLIFIVLVAAFSIANTLITSVYQKTREIGMLKALGTTRRQIMTVFLLQGLGVGVIGSGLGTLLGTVVITFRMQIMHAVSAITGQPLFPPELYFFNELPAHIVGSDVAIIVLSSIVLCTAGALVPALHAARLAPAHALRYE